MKILNRVIKDQKGSVVVVVAAAIVVLLGITAFVVDYGYLALNKRNMQNAADAAALASAAFLPNGDVQSESENYTEKHNITSGVVATKQNGNREVKVEITKSVNRFFGAVFGNGDYIIRVQAVAMVELPGQDILPFTVRDYTQIRDDIEFMKNEIVDEVVFYENDNNDEIKIRFNQNELEIRVKKQDGNYDWIELFWEDDAYHFYYLFDCLIKLKKEGFFNYGLPEDGYSFSLWTSTGDPGTWGLLDLSDFLPPPSNIEAVLLNGLETGVCGANAIGFYIEPEGGVNANILQANANALQTRLEDDRGWMIFSLPSLTPFKPNVQIKDGEYIWARVVGLYYEELTDANGHAKHYLHGLVTSVGPPNVCPDIFNIEGFDIFLIR